MTDETEKKSVAFYIFAPDGKGGTSRVGAAFFHKGGKGLNIVISEKRFIAFPPKPKS